MAPAEAPPITKAIVACGTCDNVYRVHEGRTTCPHCGGDPDLIVSVIEEEPEPAPAPESEASAGSPGQETSPVASPAPVAGEPSLDAEEPEPPAARVDSPASSSQEEGESSLPPPPPAPPAEEPADEA